MATATVEIRFSLPAGERARILYTAQLLLDGGVPSADVHRYVRDEIARGITIAPQRQDDGERGR